MRRALILGSCLAACGRFEFSLQPEPRDGGLEPSIDAAPVACAVEGSSCDDLDICTASSTCTAGVCVGPPLGPCTVANFADEYSDTQGTNGWFYGAWNTTADTDTTYDPAVDFEAFAYFDGLWRPTDWAPTGPTFTWAYIIRWGGHPGSFPINRYPARRWVSDVVGHANVVVHFAKSDPSGGDGTGLLLYVDGALLVDRTVAFDDATGFTESIPVELAIGTRIDAMMTFIGDDAVDTSVLEVQVVSR